MGMKRDQQKLAAEARSTPCANPSYSNPNLCHQYIISREIVLGLYLLVVVRANPSSISQETLCVGSNCAIG